MTRKKTALYPGTFDPITNGHFDIIERSLGLFDEIIIAVASSEDKQPMFTLEERIHMIKEATHNLDHVSVVGFDNLTVELARAHDANILIRGLRTASDFEYELQLAYLNNSLDNSIETVYLMPKLQHAFVSSSFIRNLLKFNGKIDHLLPKSVEEIIGNIR
ncbi:MAG: pantetheine-phosphate adenylyltransferase [Sulfurimonas sp.]|uniref:pantetheine-phosphate adenylyltransferase n=1 Tax=Sulfurimonas sp. TaxID=2022749 RepID=UPI0039E59222